VTIQADYVVVGGGSAGAVIATRLSEDPTKHVILIEAGGSATSFLVRMPAGYARLLNNPAYDWCYQQDADPSILNRHFVWSAGKMLGGGSSINGQVYIRGTSADYQQWVDSGCAGWSFQDCLPYFIRSERFNGPDAPWHGKDGPLSVTTARDPHPLTRNFLEACSQTHIATLADYSDGNADGAFMTLATQYPNGTRCSTALSFLSNARRRKNLTVVTDALAEKILFEGKIATGVRAKVGGRFVEYNASKEVIISCGTVGSPALLLRSGIGPIDQLNQHGISVIHENAAVGQNLQEHVGVSVNKYVNVPTINSQLRWHHVARHMLKYLLVKKGPMVTPAVQAMALARTSPDLHQPDVQLHFLPLSFDVDPEMTSNAMAFMPSEPTVMISATTCRPRSRGQIRLRSSNVEDLPQISHELLGDRRDVETLTNACKLIEKIFRAPAWSGVVTRARTPQYELRSDLEWENFIRAHAIIGYHMVGTCRMGLGSNTVVDNQLRVQGVQGLRVADASIMPNVTSTNTNAASIMIGERAADFILTSTA
jgi:choline dehydrogenase